MNGMDVVFSKPLYCDILFCDLNYLWYPYFCVLCSLGIFRCFVQRMPKGEIVSMKILAIFILNKKPKVEDQSGPAHGSRPKSMISVQRPMPSPKPISGIKHACAYHVFFSQDRKAVCYPDYLGFHLWSKRSFSRLLFVWKIFSSLDIFLKKHVLIKQLFSDEVCFCFLSQKYQASFNAFHASLNATYDDVHIDIYLNTI